VGEIQKKVAEHYSVKLADMSSTRRARQVSAPRQVAMYLAKKLTTMSLPEIGKHFGGRDHTTVLHAFKKVEETIKNDGNLAEDVRLLTNILTKKLPVIHVRSIKLMKMRTVDDTARSNMK
jgi:chromosomal replication initiator protein